MARSIYSRYSPIRWEFEQAEWEALLRQHQHWLDTFKPSNTFGKFILKIADMVRDEAELNTHIMTGALASSHRVDFTPFGRTGGPEATVFVSRIVNPLSGEYTDEYGILEEERHGFYRGVIEEELRDIVYINLDEFGEELFRRR